MIPGLSKPVLIAIAAGLMVAATLGIVWSIYSKGEKAGSADVKAAVSAKAVETIDNARTTKEKANEAVRSKPIDAVIDGLQ